MKRIVSILLTICMLLSLSTMLASCGHDCVFSEDWTKDATHHWHACAHEDCTELTDKAEHVWDEGQITTKATQEAAGVKTFTCKTCAQTKTEAIEFTGLSEEEWNIALSEFTFENVSYEESAISSKGDKSGTVKYKLTKDLVWIQRNAIKLTDEEEIKTFRRALVDSIREIVPYESYQYDAATKTYKATEKIYFSALKTSTQNVTLTFANGRLVEIKYEVKIYAVGDDYTVTATIKLSDYGTTTITY
ncbi:MAG: hypothetical protein IJW49_04210 [Clostridia bacterium]|nr:hypothetical protein [Clostridia bacterium]